MDEVLVFQHDPFEDLGFFAEVLEKQGANYRVIRLFHGEMPEAELKNVRLLIVLGGSMGWMTKRVFRFCAGKNVLFARQSTRRCRFWEFALARS